MAALNGGCSAPVAAACKVEGSKISIKGGVWSLNGSIEIVEERETTLPEENTTSLTSDKSDDKTSICI